jgi:hypothetical protein
MPKRGRQASARVQAAVLRLGIGEGRGAAWIHRELFPNGAQDPDHVTVKTIQRMIQDLRGPTADTSKPWTFLAADAEDAARILDVAAHVCDMSDGREWLTQEQAAWVLRVRIAAPDAPSYWAWWLAHAYHLLADDPNADSRALDLTLAAAPWVSEERALGWRALLRKDTILATAGERVRSVLKLLSLSLWEPKRSETFPFALEPEQRIDPDVFLRAEGERQDDAQGESDANSPQIPEPSPLGTPLPWRPRFARGYEPENDAR